MGRQVFWNAASQQALQNEKARRARSDLTIVRQRRASQGDYERGKCFVSRAFVLGMEKGWRVSCNSIASRALAFITHPCFS